MEFHTIHRIPDNARHGKPRDLFAIWFSANMSLLTVVTGSLGPAIHHLSFVSAIFSLLFGNLVGGVFMALHAAQGPALGVPQMIQSRGQFGSIGSIPIITMVIVMYIGFVASNLVVGPDALRYVVPTDSRRTVVFFMVLLSIVPCVIGYKFFHKFSVVFSFFSTLSVIYCLFKIFIKGGWSILLANHGSFAGCVQTFSIAVLWQISYAPYVSDSSRYLPPDPKIYRGTFLACYAGSVIGAFLSMGLGAALTVSMPSFTIVDAIGHICGSLGAPVMLVFGLSVALTSSMDLYCSSLSTLTLFQTVFQDWVPNYRERIFISVIFSIFSFFIASFLSASFLKSYESLLDLLMAVMIPWTAINLIDFYYFAHGNYDIDSFFRADGGVYGKINKCAIFSYVIGVICELPFLSLNFFKGLMVEYLCSVDISWVVSLIVSSLSYIFCVNHRKLIKDRSHSR